MNGNKDITPLAYFISYPWLLDLTLQCHEQQHRPAIQGNQVHLDDVKINLLNGFIIYWILDQIIMFSNKVYFVAG